MLGKVLVAVVVAALMGAASARATTVFVAPVTGAGDDDGRIALTRAIETALVQRVIGVDVVTPRALDTKLELDLMKACKGDGDDAACVVDFAQGMGVDLVIRSQLQHLADQRILTISLFDGKRAALLGQAQKKASDAGGLVDQVPGMVADVARAGNLRVVVETVKAPPYLAYSEIGGGVVVGLASLAVHGAAFAIAEPAYESASFDRSGDRAWEFARPFAYVGPVLGYIGAATLVGMGAYALATAAP